MNRFASHNPERYEQMIERHGTIEEAFRADADAIRQRQKDCSRCDGSGEVPYWPQDDSTRPDWEPCPECRQGKGA